MEPVASEYDPVTGVLTEYAFGDGKMYVRTSVLDSAHHLRYTAALRNDPGYSKRGIKNDMLHTGHIPPEVVLRWQKEGFDVITAHPDEINKRLQRPEYAYLRTTDRKF